MKSRGIKKGIKINLLVYQVARIGRLAGTTVTAILVRRACVETTFVNV